MDPPDVSFLGEAADTPEQSKTQAQKTGEKALSGQMQTRANHLGMVAHMVALLALPQRA